VGCPVVKLILPSFEWDTMAGHAILKGAGGRLINFDRIELKYRKPGLNNHLLYCTCKKCGNQIS
jgi:3'-phosphoadenosine 5'-phosphosulfate (PAPS) 3'-phosphatase